VPHNADNLDTPSGSELNEGLPNQPVGSIVDHDIALLEVGALQKLEGCVDSLGFRDFVCGLLGVFGLKVCGLRKETT